MELTKGQYHSYKLHTVPADAASATYKLSAPYFSTRSVEQWSQLHKNVNHVIIGQNATNSPSKFAVARCPLEGDALHAFDNKAKDGTETNDLYEACMNAVATEVFPKRAVQVQKQYL